MERSSLVALGLSADQLERIKTELVRRTQAQELPGAVFLVAKGGKIAAVEAVGVRNPLKGTPMREDSIFRIASMTKPIVSVAAMMLVERGRLALRDPVAHYLPEFQTMRVAVEERDSDGKVSVRYEPARTTMTVHDLFRHTAGLTSGNFDNSHVDKLMAEAGVLDADQTLAEQIARLAKLPLKYQPGSTFEYSISVNVLGRIVEVVSGLELDQFIKQHITDPLKMPDTGFWVPARHHDRLAFPQINPVTGSPFFLRPVEVRPKHLNPGGGMVSTALDYARFCQMLLNGGQLDGVRLLSPSSVELMTSDHLHPGLKLAPRYALARNVLIPVPELGMGFGLGFAVRTHPGRSALHGSVGEFWWSGATGTNFVVDPRHRLILILLTQQPNRLAEYMALMRNMGYPLLLEPPKAER
jgi:CubicO group peptidase (beta-lactamase class C family)